MVMISPSVWRPQPALTDGPAPVLKSFLCYCTYPSTHKHFGSAGMRRLVPHGATRVLLALLFLLSLASEACACAYKL